MLQPPLRSGHPVTGGIRRIVAYQLLMSALQIGNPLEVFIHMKTDNFAGSSGRSRLHGFHV